MPKSGGANLHKYYGLLMGDLEAGFTISIQVEHSKIQALPLYFYTFKFFMKTNFNQL